MHLCTKTLTTLHVHKAESHLCTMRFTKKKARVMTVCVLSYTEQYKHEHARHAQPRRNDLSTTQHHVACRRNRFRTTVAPDAVRACAEAGAAARRDVAAAPIGGHHREPRAQVCPSLSPAHPPMTPILLLHHRQLPLLCTLLPVH